MKELISLATLLLFAHLMIAQVGINTEAPQGEFHVTKPYIWEGSFFVGSGIDDIAIDISGFTGSVEVHYIAKITNAGPNPQIFQWSDDNGLTWSADLPISTAAIPLSNGISISWGAVDGHIYDDSWSWTIGPDYPNGLIVKNARVGIGFKNFRK